MPQAHSTKPQLAGAAGPPDPEARAAAIRRLVEGGAHLLPTVGKAPRRGFRWKDRRLTLPEALQWAGEGGRLGIIPASLGCTVADVDRGDPERLVATWRPLLELRTRREGGKHLWYQDSTARPNATWEAFGCGGDIRSGGGYVLFWRQPGGEWAEVLLAMATVFGREQGVLFPADEFHLQNNPARPPGKRVQAADPAERLRWGAVGRRHKDLHAGLKREGRRLLAQGHLEGRGAHLDDREGFRRALRFEAERLNGRFAEPLPESEVERLVDWHCRAWFKSRKRFLEGESEAVQAFKKRQSRRGKRSGEVRRAQGEGLRQRIIAARIDTGASCRQLAAEFGESKSKVGRILRAGLGPA